ncbi:hypothetical protein J7I80_11675 [Bacillus sp. ISL-41]|uniref:hypothetical protein n=1 Tax=Bacillus sp. ISL-41 TaxID=2819127 RepID=UPI001BE91D67|nr:hypothetical protein [Bacillus sp. ISL-41]MBT2642888.1 hypothetical protein [Bacillus sp. ISL-41]
MSWFKEREAYSEHMAYRDLNPNRYVEKYGTNKHSDHSKVLSNDLSINQNLVDKLIYKIMSLLPNRTLAFSHNLTIILDSKWSEHKDNDSSVIGCSLLFSLIQNGLLLRRGRIILSNWGNRGEPASVYEDAFSRFIIVELLKPKSTSNYNGINQYGFHKYLNAKYAKLMPEFKMLGVQKELKGEILKTLETVFGLTVKDQSILLKVVNIHEGTDDELLEFLLQLIIIGLVKEVYRCRLPEIQLINSSD